MQTATFGSPTAQKPVVYIPPNFVVRSWSPTFAGREAKCSRLKSHMVKPPMGPGQADRMGRIRQQRNANARHVVVLQVAFDNGSEPPSTGTRARRRRGRSQGQTRRG